MKRDLAAGLAPLAALEDGLRRRIYLFVRQRGRAVSREETAEELGISRKLAAFHLDKLAERGLLRFHYARPPGRGGPGAGRPAKRYEVSGLEIEVSIPGRRYDMVGSLLLDAIGTSSAEEPARERAPQVAWEAGLRIGEAVREAKRLRPPGPERTLAVAEEILADYGFEPYRSRPGELALRNCPFHALARRAPDLVCCMNRAFIDGLLRGLGTKSVKADLEPTEGRCCVRIRRPSSTG